MFSSVIYPDPIRSFYVTESSSQISKSISDSLVLLNVKTSLQLGYLPINNIINIQPPS